MKNILKIEINKNRVFGLDILRAFAIIFVMLTHGANFLPKELAALNKKLLFDGVGIFFVLSGFLIGGILIKLLESYHINKGLLFGFWIKRWFRTLPNYYLVLTILFIISIIFNSSFDPLKYLNYFLFLQNVSEAPLSFFSESWSLSIEEWFYISIPLLIFILLKIFKISVKTSILVSIISIIFSITLYRYIYYLKLDDYTYENFEQIRYAILGRLDSLMYGVLGAYLYYYKNNFWNKNKLLFLITGICLILIFYIFPLDSNYIFRIVFSFSLTSFSIFLLLPYFNSIKTGKGIFYKILTHISLISYSLYLLNLQISYVLEHCINWNKFIILYNTYISDKYTWAIALLINYILFWGFSILLSILLYKYYEIPMMQLRDHKIIQNFTKKYMIKK